MRVPLSWLREYVAVDLDTDALAERLTLLGMEVKGIERLGDAWQSVVVGELLEVRPHPGSSRLSLTRVLPGAGETVLSIVCGATNIAAGQRVPVALPGAVLPGDRRIDVTRIAGEESQGMLCSGAELGITTDADGILILPPETPLGRSLADLMGDVVLDVDVKPNRGDALSMIGLAREVAAATGAPLTWPDISVDESGDATSDHLRVAVEDPRCTRFVGRYLDGVTIGPSSFEIQRRLGAAGVRPISNVVDASNYVMLELGKPIHTFDAAAVHEGRIVVRAGVAGERLETLDHTWRDLDPEALLIADATGPLALAGVMGGASSEISASTSTVIVESAIFDPVAIRRTAFRYALRSEASLRFEKGQEHRLARIGADRTAQLILRWAGGRAAHGAVDTAPTDPAPLLLPFRPARISRLLGLTVPPQDQRALLRRVAVETRPAAAGDVVPIIAGAPGVTLDAATAGDALVAIVPSHRPDLQIEADIAEEVARVRGYETVPGRLPATTMPGFRPDPRRLVDGLRDSIAARGFTEVVSHGLVAPEDHARLGIAPHDPETIRAANPVTVDHSELRRSLLPGHLRILGDNERQRRSDLALFEIGPLHRRVLGAPVERQVLALLAAGSVTPVSWQAPSRNLDMGDLKGLVEWIVERFGEGSVRYAATLPRGGVDHPGRTAAILVDLPSGHSVDLGRVGELDPRYLAAYEIRAGQVAFAELDLDGLARLIPASRRVDTLDRLPAIERDLAVVVDAGRPAGDVASVIREVSGPQLRSLRLFDRYQGPQIAETEVGLAWRLRFEPTDRAIEDAEIDERLAAVVRELLVRLGARLRA